MANANKLFAPPAVSHTKPSASLAFLQRNFNIFAAHSNMSFLKFKESQRLSRGRRVVNVLERSPVNMNKTEDFAKNDNKVIVGGRMLVMEKTVLGYNDIGAAIIDSIDEMIGRKISVELISAVKGDPADDMRGIRSKPAYLENWKSTSHGWKPGESSFKFKFEWSEDLGAPGALIIRNNHHKEFYLKSVTLDDVPNYDKVHFVCNSWIYPVECYKNECRIFFSNKTYLPNETPEPLRRYRNEELETLRGNGKRELKEWDRVYDYAYYNDLGKPDKGSEHARPILGGSKEYPYPRRCQTGRPPTKTDTKTESRLSYLRSLDIYVPRDERFGHVKMADYLSHTVSAVGHALEAGLEGLDTTPTEFDCLDDTLKLYKEGIKLPDVPLLKEKPMLHWLNKLLHIDGVPHLKFPLPHIIKEHSSAWTSDEEFAREMLAGVNPVIIRRLEVFPPTSMLDPKAYGDQSSSITKDHIESTLEGLTVYEAIKNKKLFILDHHDALMPYLRRINTTTTKTYATRTLLFLKDDGTLEPVAIELSLPHHDGDDHGAVSKVFTPAKGGVEGSMWQLAKVYVSVNDSGYHQLISHWLNTHAVMEPFVIATNRQLSVLHPIYKLLHPHFRDTMSINALARQMLIGAEGILESTVFPGKYAMEMSSAVYKSWVFKDQALPKDLLKRGMAEKDPESPHGYRLLIEDYPYAVDGLEIWSAIEGWVRDYCSFYYKTDDMVINDIELQSWWKEVREEGHGDLKDETWWPEMKTVKELIETCTIILWIASALHAAVNFGQYPYAGYLPNRPTISRRFMPEPNTSEFEELKTNFEATLLKTITSQFKTLLGVSLIEILSTHSSDEVYLGQRDPQEWTSDAVPLEAFNKFGKRLERIEAEITERNRSGKVKNRVGPVNMPYTLLIHSSEPGVTAQGIPNSVSI